MRDALSGLGNGISDLTGLLGRGFWGAATLGATELSRANQREEEQKKLQQAQQLANIMSGQSIPEFLRPGQTVESYTPEQFADKKTEQLLRLGTPAAQNLASKFIETPESLLQKANIESEIANRTAQRNLQAQQLGLQKEELEFNKQEKLRNYNLAVKELEAKLKGGLTDPKEVFDRETKLRNEFITQSKDFITQRDAYDKIAIAAKDPSAAGDISLIYGFMKLNDPTSTVREGEYATAQNAGGINDRVRSMYNKAISGERLSDNVRNDFVDRSKRLFEGSKRQHDKRVEQYSSLAERAGANPKQVIVDVGLAETPEEKRKPLIGSNLNGWSIKPLGGK